MEDSGQDDDAIKAALINLCRSGGETVKVLGAIREAIPEDELQAHLNKYSNKFESYGFEYHWTTYNDEQLVQLFSDGLNDAFFNYLKEKRLFYFFDEQSWGRFIKDYDLWKQGDSPSCKEGNPWLWYEEYIQDGERETPYWKKKGQEANERDKISFFKLIDTLMIPIEFFVPESIVEKQQIERIDYSTVVQRLVDYHKIKRRFVESYPIKVKAPEREFGSIVRRTDFSYMNGHGTFYRFDKDHFPDNLFKTKEGDRISVVLYNIHTDQLDEVVFIMQSYRNVGENCIDIRGYIADIEKYYEIEISYYKNRPLKSYILVFASAQPDYRCFDRLKN